MVMHAGGQQGIPTLCRVGIDLQHPRWSTCLAPTEKVFIKATNYVTEYPEPYVTIKWDDLVSCIIMNAVDGTGNSGAVEGLLNRYEDEPLDGRELERWTFYIALLALEGRGLIAMVPVDAKVHE